MDNICWNGRQHYTGFSYDPSSCSSCYAEREHGGMGQEVKNSVQILVAWAARGTKVQKILTMKVIWFLWKRKRFLCPLSLQHFKPGQLTRHKASGTLVECHAAHHDPIPWGPQWLAAIITLKVHVIIPGGLN